MGLNGPEMLLHRTSSRLKNPGEKRGRVHTSQKSGPLNSTNQSLVMGVWAALLLSPNEALGRGDPSYR